MAKIIPIDNPRVLPKDVPGQVLKIMEELGEFLEAALKDDWEHADEEAMDLIVAVRTYFAMRGKSEEEVDALYNFVELKNLKRGYYNLKPLGIV